MQALLRLDPRVLRLLVVAVPAMLLLVISSFVNGLIFLTENNN